MRKPGWEWTSTWHLRKYRKIWLMHDQRKLVGLSVSSLMNDDEETIILSYYLFFNSIMMTRTCKMLDGIYKGGTHEQNKSSTIHHLTTVRWPSSLGDEFIAHTVQRRLWHAHHGATQPNIVTLHCAWSVQNFIIVEDMVCILPVEKMCRWLQTETESEISRQTYDFHFIHFKATHRTTQLHLSRSAVASLFCKYGSCWHKHHITRSDLSMLAASQLSLSMVLSFQWVTIFWLSWARLSTDDPS